MRINGWSTEPDKDSALYQKPKTKEELAKEEKERKERNVKLTRIAKGIGILIRGFGRAFYKIGDSIVRACDKSLGKPENKAILRKMGKLPPNEKKKEDKKEESKKDKNIVITIPG